MIQRCLPETQFVGDNVIVLVSDDGNELVLHIELRLELGNGMELGFGNGI